MTLLAPTPHSERRDPISASRRTGRPSRWFIIAFAALSAGCGRVWDLAQPFAISIDSPEIPADAARGFLAAALAQLGAYTSPAAAQVLHVRLDAACSCRSCESYTVAHTEPPSQDTIQLCPGYLKEPADGLQDNLTHELGHVLGDWDHLPCETGAMMTPQYNCRVDHAHYQKLDVEAICGAGGAFNGVCG